MSFLAFILFGIYHVCVLNPEAFNALKMFALFSVIQGQMFLEHCVAEGKKVWHRCEKYVQKNLVTREKIFSNEHILSCSVISYNLNDNSTGSKTSLGFSNALIKEAYIVPNNSLIITEIKFDTLDVVRLTYNHNITYPMEVMHEVIDKQFACGYPTKLQCPFMCVEVVYNDNRYDVTGLLKEYLYSGNIILSSQFTRMLMWEHLDVYIKPNTPFSLHTVDHEVNMNDIHFVGDEEHGSYAYAL